MVGEIRDVRGFRIKGRVQGVFFRAWTRATGRELGLRGCVRNLPDGSVEAWAEGTPESLDLFEGRLRVGPPAALVESVERGEPGGPLPREGFEILH